MREVENKSLLEGIRVGKYEINVNMLQFAYYTLFMCMANMRNIITLKGNFRYFEITSDLKVNKSLQK